MKILGLEDCGHLTPGFMADLLSLILRALMGAGLRATAEMTPYPMLGLIRGSLLM